MDIASAFVNLNLKQSYMDAENTSHGAFSEDIFVLASGAIKGFEEYAANIKKTAAANKYFVSLGATEGALKIRSKEELIFITGANKFIEINKNHTPDFISDKNKLLILCGLSLSMLSKISNGYFEDTGYIIYKFLSKGKPVYASKAGFLDEKVKEHNAGLYNLVLENIKKAEKLGLIFKESFEDKPEKEIINLSSEKAPISEKSIKERFTGKVLTEAKIAQYPKGSVINLGCNTVITPFAKDFASENHISLIKTNELN